MEDGEEMGRGLGGARRRERAWCVAWMVLSWVRRSGRDGVEGRATLGREVRGLVMVERGRGDGLVILRE